MFLFWITHLLLWGRGNVKTVNLVAGGFAFILGALPYIIKFLALSHASENIPITILEFRTPYLFLDDSGLFGKFYQCSIIPALLAVAGLWIKYRSDWNDQDGINLRFLIAVFLLAFTVLLGEISRTFLQLQPLRVLQYLYPFIIIYSFAPFFPANMNEGLRNKIITCIIFILVVMVPFHLLVLNGGKNRSNRKKYSPPGAIVDITDNWSDLQDLTTWCSLHTPVDSVFLVPPYGMAIFRVFSTRGIVVSYKDGCTSAFDGDYANTWYSTYTNVFRAYEMENRRALVEAANMYNAQYIIVKNEYPIEFLEPVYKNNTYSVYQPLNSE
jgi:hypothetical protein